MNSVKTVFVIAILGAVAYGAYLTITRKEEQAKPQTEAPPFVSSTGGSSSVPAKGAPAVAGPQVSLPRVDLTPPAVAATPNLRYGNEVGAPSVLIPSESKAAVAAAGPSEGTPSPLSPPANPTPVAPSKASTKIASRGSATGTSGALLPSGSLVRRADPPAAPPAGGGPGRSPTDKHAASMEIIQKQLDEGRLKQAHLALTNLYNQPDLRPYQRSQVTDLLDQLAGHIIYSREHLLEPPYVVKAGDTLETIARSYNVPAQLLANINGIGDRRQLRLGRKLKVVRGPFNAIVNLSDYELTLTVGGRYAGRFAIGVGEDCAQLTNRRTLLVSGKTTNPTYYGSANEQIAAGDPSNPLGKYSIALSDPNGAPTRISIHGTNTPTNLHQTGGRGSICLDAKDIKDIFGILSAGPVPPSPGSPIASKVTIVR